MVRTLSTSKLGLLILVALAVTIWVFGATREQLEKIRRENPDAVVIELSEPLAVSAPPQLPPGWDNNWSPKGKCLSPDFRYRKKQFFTDISSVKPNGSLRIQFSNAGDPFLISVEQNSVRISMFTKEKNFKIYQVPKDIFLKYLNRSNRTSVVEATREALANAIQAGADSGYNTVWTLEQIVEWLGMGHCK